MRPNLFKYATTELSQDAFICWLLEWANPENEQKDSSLNKVAIRLINTFFEKGNIEKPLKYNNIVVKKQYENIDVLCIVNHEYAIIIEDKTNTKNHSGQLKRYFEHIKQDFSKDKIISIYFKTGDQDNYNDVIKNGYKLFLRKDFLSILNYGLELGVKNDIFEDFKKYLQNIENKRNSYLTKPIDKWYDDNWIGFFINLRKELKEGGWNYIPNRSGGFMGFWWFRVEIEYGKVYLQIEENRFCFKVSVKEKNKRSEIRNKIHNTIIGISKKLNIDVIKPSKFGNGHYMTVAILKDEYRITNSENIIDMEKTIENIKTISKILDKIEK